MGRRPDRLPGAEDSADAGRYRAIFRRLHARHATCLDDEWLMAACRDRRGRPLDRPVVWSRRNGPWRQVDVLWTGAAPGNDGGRGGGERGAHGTRIPFGGDIAGANLEVLFGSIGLDRNRTFISASLNELPAAGGGEPTNAELLAPRGEYPNSIAVVRDTLLAAGPSLIVALGNVALRVVVAAVRTQADRLPSIDALRREGWDRGRMRLLDDDASGHFLEHWQGAWRDPLPSVLWLVHPSAQNMSPYARRETVFHTRMVDAVSALRGAVGERLGWQLPDERPAPPADGIYALPEWRERIAPRNAHLDRLWREKGV
jgi:uracil-DNA glycosylase